LDIRRNQLPASPVSLGTSHHNLANIHLCLHHYDLALEHNKKIIKPEATLSSSSASKYCHDTHKNIGIINRIKNEFQ